MAAMAGHQPQHFNWCMLGAVAVISLNRPDPKNLLTFESYNELRDTFRALVYADDVHDIIGPLVAMDMKDLLAFTRMTGDLVKAMINCGKPVISAVDGICVGAAQ